MTSLFSFCVISRSITQPVVPISGTARSAGTAYDIIKAWSEVMFRSKQSELAKAVEHLD